MNISFACRELAEVLTGLGKVIPRKTTLPVCRHVRITAGANKPIQLFATNLDEHLCYTFPDAYSDESSFDLIIPHKELLTLIRSAKDDQATIKTSRDSETAQITLQGALGTREHFLPVLSTDEWPKAPEPIDVHGADNQFLPQYRRLLPFTSSDPARTVITGIYLDAHSQGHVLVATDGRRLCTADGLQFKAHQHAILPRSAFLQWKRLPDDCALGVTEHEFQILVGNWSYQGKLIQGTFPNWKQVLPDSSPEDQVLSLSQEDLPILEDAIKTLPAGSQSGKAVLEAGIQLMSRGGILTVAASDTQGNWTYRELPQSTLTEGDGTSVNRQYLLQAVKAGFRTWRFRDELHPLQSRKERDVHVLMPLRREAVPPSNTKTSAKTKELESTPNPEGKIIPMPTPSEENVETQPDLLELAQTTRDQAKDLAKALGELLRQLKTEQRATRQVHVELANAQGVLQRLRDIAA